jgi:hypothetical protein
MEVDQLGTASAYADLLPGMAFRLGFRHRIHVCLKTAEAGKALGCAVLGPGHPDYNAKPGLIIDPAMEGCTVLALPGLRFVVSRDPKHWTMGQGTSLELGTVLLMPNRTMLCVGHEKSQAVKVDVGTGEIVQEKLTDVPIIVRSWSLVNVTGDKAETVFEFAA